MTNWLYGERYQLHILETPQAMQAVEDLQRAVWSGSETEIVPAHLLLAIAHHGGLVIGAYCLPQNAAVTEQAGLPPCEAGSPCAELAGFVLGFPGLYDTPDGPRLKQHSHMLGVHPAHRNQGLGFVLKRAQWQMVRRQGIDRITWTYDPLLSRNAHLNIARLGAVCNTYLRDVYGELRDDLNAGLSTDRFQVDWWVNSKRVVRRLSKTPRGSLDLAHFLAAETPMINPTHIAEDGLARPSAGEIEIPPDAALLLVEIPADFQALRAADPSLASEWRLHTRHLFERLFERGYLVTDFVHLPGTYPRSFYVLSDGESLLGGLIGVTHP
ncbi:MAG: hypothetical protein AB1894_12615 [Chloroflexota bacterium]